MRSDIDPDLLRLTFIYVSTHLDERNTIASNFDPKLFFKIFAKKSIFAEKKVTLNLA